MSLELKLLRQYISELKNKNIKLETEKAELIKQIMEKDTKRNVKNIELKSKVKKLEVRLAILEQDVTKVNRQPQNDKKVITQVSAIDIFDSIINQQNDVKTKSIEDKKIGNFIPKESANVSDLVITQSKQCKPLQIEKVTTKVNY